MAEHPQRFAEALEELNAVADEVTADEAQRTFDEATLQVFWREWPHISSWAGALWRRLNEDVQPLGESDDVGGEGG